MEPRTTRADPSARARVDRRSLIKKGVVAGAVAWTAPVIVESVTNPAGALTCGPGTYYVVYELALAQRTPLSAGCASQSGINTSAAAIGLTAAFTGSCSGVNGSIAHQASNTGYCQPVKLTLASGNGCNCYISSVSAQVHLRGPGDCPPAPGCITAATGSSAYLRITAGSVGVGSQTVTVAPNYTNTSLCSSGIHWGRPATGTTGGAVNNERGYLVVQVKCT